MPRDPRVIYVDFHKGRAPKKHFGSGWSLTLVVFGVVVALEIGGAAWLTPGVIPSAFFAPTVIVVAVIAALGARRLANWIDQARQRSKPGYTQGASSHDEPSQRTLH